MEVEPSHTGFPLASCGRGVTVTRRFWCHDFGDVAGQLRGAAASHAGSEELRKTGILDDRLSISADESPDGEAHGCRNPKMRGLRCSLLHKLTGVPFTQ